MEKRIKEIWDSNPKIPFMQSKDILTLGYIYGKEDSQQQKPKEKTPIQVVENSNEFIGNTKEQIDYAQKKVKDKNALNIKKLKAESELKLIESKVTLTGMILNYMSTNQDFWSVYEFIKGLNEEYRYELYKLNHGL